MADNNGYQIDRFLPEAYLKATGKNLPALRKALGQGIDEAQSVLQSVIDQLFLVTASGKYLVSLGAQEGFVMPPNSGLDIRSYRVLVPIMVSSPKQVRISVNELLEAFYGSERVRPSISSDVLEPYVLKEGDDLIVETNRGISSIALTSAQIRDFDNVSAQEIAAILNAVQDDYQARAVQDRATGKKFLRIISEVEGNGSFIRVAGGKLQNVLKFPTLVDSAPAFGTIWNITKETYYSDIVRFTWNGTGTNPQVFNVSAGDVVTIRGLSGFLTIDGSQPSEISFSDLNGSYEVIDSGYDYFEIKNISYLNEPNIQLSQQISQPEDNNVVFTSKDKITLFDQEEYAYSSEISSQTITITIPAVPPILKRFLQGSAHLRASAYNVLDFSRNSLLLEASPVLGVPASDNAFVLSSNYLAEDFSAKKYKTDSISEINGNYSAQLVVNNEDYAILPYTVPQAIEAECLRADPRSSEYKLTFPFRHGLVVGSGFTLSGFDALSSSLTGFLNKEHFVKSVIDEYTISFLILNDSGDPIKFDGLLEDFSAEVYQYDQPQPNGADFYIELDPQIQISLKIGDKFSFVEQDSNILNYTLYNELMNKVHTVVGINGQKIDFYADVGIGSSGLVFSNYGLVGQKINITAGTNLTINKIVYNENADNGQGGKGLFIALGDDGYAYSADGTIWQEVATAGVSWTDATYRPETQSSGAIFVLAGYTPTAAKNAIIPESSLSSYQIYDMLIANQSNTSPWLISWSSEQAVFFAAGEDGLMVSTSESPQSPSDWDRALLFYDLDKIESISATSSFLTQNNGLMYSIVYDPLAPGAIVNGLVITTLIDLSSYNSTSWLPFSYSPSLNRAVIIGWSNQQQKGNIAYGPPSGGWQVASQELANEYKSVFWSYEDSCFIALGIDGWAAYSTDGITWTEKQTNIDALFTPAHSFSDSVKEKSYSFSSDISSSSYFYITDLSVIDVKKTAFLGDDASSYYFDKTSSSNKERYLSTLRADFISYKAPENPDFLGPYLYDTQSEKYNITVSKYIANTRQTLLKGTTASIIELDSSTITEGFPASGYFVIDYGKTTQEGPVAYSAISLGTSSSQLIIDASYRFKYTHGLDSQIHFLHQNISYIPNTTGTDYPFYITGTASARNALFDLIELLVAAGVFVESDVNLPGLRNEDASIAPFE